MGSRAIRLSIGGGVAAAVAVVALPVAVGAQSTPRCVAQDLAGAIIDVQGGAGSRDGRLILINKASRTCHTKGFIGGQFVGVDGRSIATHVTRNHRTAAKTVVIRSGAAAALAVHWNVIPSGTASCPKARWLRVTPPDDTATLRVYFGDTPCRGELTVGPLTNPASV
jgi:Protein of unknown function (DUF4232)